MVDSMDIVVFASVGLMISAVFAQIERAMRKKWTLRSHLLLNNYFDNLQMECMYFLCCECAHFAQQANLD